MVFLDSSQAGCRLKAESGLGLQAEKSLDVVLLDPEGLFGLLSFFTKTL